jgi:hypothetical protein
VGANPAARCRSGPAEDVDSPLIARVIKVHCDRRAFMKYGVGVDNVAVVANS